LVLQRIAAAKRRRCPDQLNWRGLGWWDSNLASQKESPPMTKNLEKTRPAATKVRRNSRADKTGEQTAASEGMATPRAKPTSKIDQVIALLSRPNGATLDDLVAATGWQPHTTRAALTGMKKKGHSLSSNKIDGIRRYRVGKPS
jgi:hypothetical protein